MNIARALLPQQLMRDRLFAALAARKASPRREVFSQPPEGAANINAGTAADANTYTFRPPISPGRAHLVVAMSFGSRDGLISGANVDISTTARRATDGPVLINLLMSQAGRIGEANLFAPDWPAPILLEGGDQLRVALSTNVPGTSRFLSDVGDGIGVEMISCDARAAKAIRAQLFAFQIALSGFATTNVQRKDYKVTRETIIRRWLTSSTSLTRIDVDLDGQRLTPEPPPVGPISGNALDDGGYCLAHLREGAVVSSMIEATSGTARIAFLGESNV